MTYILTHRAGLCVRYRKLDDGTALSFKVPKLDATQFRSRKEAEQARTTLPDQSTLTVEPYEQ